jgi:hypothetical protein
MSNKETCPVCDVHLSSIWAAFQECRPCPNCGAPWSLVETVREFRVQAETQRRDGLNAEMADELASTKIELAVASAEIDRLRLRFGATRQKVQSLFDAYEPGDAIRLRP